MSILNINEEQFKVRAIDFMDNPDHDIEVRIWAALPSDKRAVVNKEINDMRVWVYEKSQAIRDQILVLDSIKPTGREIRKILKNVLGINLSVRVRKYMFRDNVVQAYYDIAANAKNAFADRICYIMNNGTIPYNINSISINISYPKMTVPEEGLRF